MKSFIGMTIFARPTDTRPGPTLMGQILPDPIKNRIEFGFLKKKKTQSGSKSGLDFYKNLARTRPNPVIYIYIYCYDPKIPNLTQNLFKVFSCLSMLSSLSPLTHSPLLPSLILLPCLTTHAVSRPFLMLSSFRSNSLCRRRRRWKSNILATKPLQSHNIAPYSCYALSLVIAEANDHNHSDL